MSKWPSYRKGAKALSMAAPRAVALGAGFQMPTAGGLLQAGRKLPFYPKVGGVLRLFNLSAPGIVLGVGLAGMKFINWWMTRPEGVFGYERVLYCQGKRGEFQQLSITNCGLQVQAPPAPPTGRPGTLNEWEDVGAGTFPGRRRYMPVARWNRTVTAGPDVSSPDIRLPPIWFPTNVLAGEPAGFGTRPIAPPISTPVGTPALPEWSSGSQPGLKDQTTGVAPPLTGVYRWSPGGLRFTSVPTVRSVPDVLTVEQKLKMSKGLQSLVLSFNATTEYADVVKALFDGIKSGPCKAGAGVNPSTAVMAQAIIECRSQMVWAQAMYNLAWANVEDMVWAKLGLPTKQAGLNYGTNAPVNIALSKALGGSLADSFSKIKDHGDGGVEFVRKVTRKVMDELLAGSELTPLPKH